ncbi:uncharacterized protein LOC143239902 [Tachypleus tridentatus]|uniref:uncharacterized protein LOC143239902 n=1 Tax=Tachypleus tridentatus TaxID=6853 RepID=UPI003FD00D4A
MGCHMKFSVLLALYFILSDLFLIIVCGLFNSDELNLISYEVDILNTPVKIGEEPSTTVLHLTSKFGQQYQCVLPQPSTATDQASSAESPKEEPDIKQLLEPLYKSPCLLKTKDWWTYEFCYGHYVKQYHLEDSKIVGQVMTLGNYESDYDWSNESDYSEKTSGSVFRRYHSQYYVNGTSCDLTGRQRKTEVRFFCEEDAIDYISRVDEPETCSYILAVHTAKVCKHPKLHVSPTKKPHMISCNPLLTEDQYEQYLVKLEESKRKAEEKRKLWLEKQHQKLASLRKWAQQQRMELENKENKKSDAGSFEKSDEDDDMVLQNLNDLEEPAVFEAESVEELNKEELAEGELEPDSNTQETIKNEGELHRQISHQLDTILNEAEEDLEEQDEDETDDAFKKLATTLNKLLKKLDKKKKKVEINEDKHFEVLEDSAEVIEDKKDKMERDIPKFSFDVREEDEVKYLEGDNKQDEKTSDESKDVLSELDDGKVKVRVRHMTHTTEPLGDKVKSQQQRVLDTDQQQKLEEAVKEKLQQAGLNTKGRKIEVKIITAGYSDDEGGKDFHTLSDEETEQFQTMILTLLMKNQEAVQEMERQKKLETNYQFVWGKELPEDEEE